MNIKCFSTKRTMMYLLVVVSSKFKLSSITLKALFVPALIALIFTVSTAQATTMTATHVNDYVNNMSDAANSRNIGKISDLISDDAVIVLSRNGENASLSKALYLNLLQRIWTNATNYKYIPEITNVIISDNQARINIHTYESFNKNNVLNNVNSISRVTLELSNDHAILLRSVSKVEIN